MGSDAYVWTEIQHFFSILKNKTPNAVVYMSPINHLVPLGTCYMVNATAEAQTDNMVNMAISNGYALAGPIMGPLYNMTGYPNMLDNTKCHPNDYGERVLGAQLIEFFDGLSSLSSTATTSTTTTTTTMTTTKTTTKPATITHSTTQMETTTLPMTITQPTTITQPMTITQPTTITQPMTITQPTTIAQTTTTQTETTTQPTTIIQPTTQTETTIQLTTITTSAASTSAYVSLGTAAIVILIVAALAAWVLRGRRP
jgi:hypothetical protein